MLSVAGLSNFTLERCAIIAGAVSSNSDGIPGFDSIGDFSQAGALSRYLDKLDQANLLPKTVLYDVHPASNYVFATMAGSFQDGSIPGKIQFGGGWWFLDQKQGIEAHLNVLSNSGLVGRFVGVFTDTRSFLSFPRHKYFRHILCDLLAGDVINGELPAISSLWVEW